MSQLRSARAATAFISALTAAIGCGSSSNENTDAGTGSAELHFAIPTSRGVESVDYTISAGSYKKTGTIDVEAVEAESGVQLDELPVRSGYTLELKAKEASGTTVCTAAQSFDVAKSETTSVTLQLHCTQTMTDGGMQRCLDGGASPVSTVLYFNDFETPSAPLEVACGNSLDQRDINTLYGSDAFRFTQQETVEGVIIHDPEGRYSNPENKGGNYAVGMLSGKQPDLLALTFVTPEQRYLNVGMFLSAIDVFGCGGPFGVSAPVLQLSLYASTTDPFDFDNRGVLLDQQTISGVKPVNDATFTWHYGTIGLDANAAKTEHLTVVFDLLESGYAVFDNLSVVASEVSGVVDENTNGIPDDEECE